MPTYQIRFYSARSKSVLDRLTQIVLRGKLIHVAVFNTDTGEMLSPSAYGPISSTQPYLYGITIQCASFKKPPSYDVHSTCIQFFNPFRRSYKGGTTNCVTYVNDHLFNTPLKGKRPEDVYQRILRESSIIARA